MVVVRVGDVRERDRHARFLHLGDVAKADPGVHPVESREARVARGVLDVVVLGVLHRCVAAGDGRVDVLGSEQAVETVVAARLIGKHVRLGMAARVADAAALGAVDGDADKVGLRQRGVIPRLDPLGRVLPEDPGHVPGRRDLGVLDHDVGGGDGAVVASRAGVGHPWRRGVEAARGDHVGQRVVDAVCSHVIDLVGPVLEGSRESGRAVRLEVAVGVGDGEALAVRIEAGERGEDPTRGVRDEDGVVVVGQRAVAGHEVEQVRHLLEVGGHAGAVAEEVRVVERDGDDVLDSVVERTVLRYRRRSVRRRGAGDQTLHREERRDGCEPDQPSHTKPPSSLNRRLHRRVTPGLASPTVTRAPLSAG